MENEAGVKRPVLGSSVNAPEPPITRHIAIGDSAVLRGKMMLKSDSESVLATDIGSKHRQNTDFHPLDLPDLLDQVLRRSGFGVPQRKGPDHIPSEELDVDDRHPESNCEGHPQSNLPPKSTSTMPFHQPP